MLRPTVVPPRDTECTDVPGGPQAQTFLAQDVPVASPDSVRVQPVGWGHRATPPAATAHQDRHDALGRLQGRACPCRATTTRLQDTTTGDLWGGSRVLRS